MFQLPLKSVGIYNFRAFKQKIPIDWLKQCLLNLKYVWYQSNNNNDNNSSIQKENYVNSQTKKKKKKKRVQQIAIIDQELKSCSIKVVMCWPQFFLLSFIDLVKFFYRHRQLYHIVASIRLRSYTFSLELKCFVNGFSLYVLFVNQQQQHYFVSFAFYLY